MERYDIAIVGTGVAGISAAITAKIRNKTVLLLGNPHLSNKIGQGHTIQNYPGLPEIAGSDLREALEKHLQKMEISITEERVTAIYQMGSYYSIQGINRGYEAKTVILATGVTEKKPLPGELEFLGRGVSYCATCDAPLYKGKVTAIVGYSKKEEEEVRFMAELVKKVLYFPQYEGEVILPENVEIIRETPVSILGTNQAGTLKTKAGNYTVDGIFLLRESMEPAQLVPGLSIEDNHVAVSRQMKTNLDGCYACGDITGTPYQYIKAAGEGNVAALSAVNFLAEKK